jgi:hypothetical protein
MLTTGTPGVNTARRYCVGCVSNNCGREREGERERERQTDGV